MAILLLIALDASDAVPLAAFAKSYGKPFDILCFLGEGPAGLGAERVLAANLDAPPPADALANGLKGLCEGYAVVAGAASMFGKDYLPRLAAALDRPMVSDVTEVHDANTFTRPMYAGNFLARVQVDSERFVVSVRTTAFSEPDREGLSAVEAISLPFDGPTRRVSVSESGGGRPDLTQARVVVSGGRPIRDAETFEKLIGGLADLLGGAAGATRAVVDNGIAPNELQVGQTGKVVAPDLYIAAGISGSTQHVAGMKDSKVIVAINTDPAAPIFEFADYGLVQDLHTAIPEMMDKLRS
ncbi:MAG: electron transfer flavoprotein subunit alpha/FixB family protein [Armatimonadetes bacterium]|nr:electron transfer flavoprotein subunit alpha/FixB family protein [Armatimonadota bacterium]